MERFKDLPEILDIKEVAQLLRIGRSQAYEIAKRKDFPKLPIERPIRVPKQELLRWAKLI